MQLVRFANTDGVRLARLADDTIIELSAADPVAIMMGLDDLTETGRSFAIDDVRLLAPVNPSKVIAIGLNYRDHAEETGLPIPDRPLIFAKFPSAVVGPHDDIVKLTETTQLDYEGELGVVIGRQVRNISPDTALQYVAGFVIANDVSARDAQFADEQWVRGKSFDTFCPLGPCLTSLDTFDDSNAVDIRTWVNGDLRQKSNTRHLIFDVSTLVSYCSKYFTLEAGDVILTGTPGGVGLSMKPPTYLQPGDVVEVEIAGLGRLSNRVTDTNGSGG